MNPKQFLIIFACGVVFGVFVGYEIFNTPDPGIVTIDGKQWHKQRDSLMQIIEHKDAVNLLLTEKAVADSLRKAKEDSVAGVLATIRLDRMRNERDSYRHARSERLDSLFGSLK